MCHNKDVMVDYMEFLSPENIHLGECHLVEAPGKGNVWVNVKMEDSYEPAKLFNVLYVPDLAKILLSTSVIAK